MPIIWFSTEFKRKKKKFKKILFEINNVKFYESLLCSILLIVFSYGSFFSINLFFLKENKLNVILNDNIGMNILLSLFTVLLAPIVEEFFFRGLLLYKLSIKFNTRVGVFLTSCFFAFFHSDVLGSFAFSVVASLIYLKTKSLFNAIILHFFYNLIILLFEIIPLKSQLLFFIKNLNISLICLLISTTILIVYIYANKTILQTKLKEMRE